MAKSSIQIHNELNDLANKISQASNEFNAAEGDAKDALRDAINQYKGEQKALNDMLGDVLNEEDKVRRGGGVPLAVAEPEKVFKPVNAAQKFLGNPADFKGLSHQMFKDGYSVKVSNAYTDFNLGEKTETDYTLPAQGLDVANFGILSTLPTGTTQADVIEFFQRDASAYVNKAGKFVKGQLKGVSSMKWKRASTHTEWIANTMPVLEPELKDYGQLEATINNELMFMNRLVLAEKVVNAEAGSANPGITGLTQIDGHLSFTKDAGDTLVDAFLKMKNDVFMATGFLPTTVAMHPFVAESVMLDKDTTGAYMNLMLDGKLWALQVVEDSNLVSGDTTKKYGAMVYFPGAATLFTKNSDTIALGLVDDQFNRNEKTIRCEGEYALKVSTPAAFSVMTDAGVTGR